MFEKFGFQFQIFSREKQEQSSGNSLEDASYLIARFDQLAQNEDFLEKLKTIKWDFIIVGEAHKMTANYSGDKLNKSLRYRFGELLGKISRYFILMTATPQRVMKDLTKPKNGVEHLRQNITNSFSTNVAPLLKVLESSCSLVLRKGLSFGYVR